MDIVNIMVVVDPQHAFIDGSLGSKAAQEIVSKVADTIRRFDGEVYETQDTHYQNYLTTREGRMLPVVHSIYGTWDWQIHQEIEEAVGLHPRSHKPILKSEFTTRELYDAIRVHSRDKGKNLRIVILGYVTNICEVSIALGLRSEFPEAEIIFDAACSVGTSVEEHRAGIIIMKSCHIVVINDQPEEALA